MEKKADSAAVFQLNHMMQRLACLKIRYLVGHIRGSRLKQEESCKGTFI